MEKPSNAFNYSEGRTHALSLRGKLNIQIPQAPRSALLEKGLVSLGLSKGRDGFLYIPIRESTHPRPLLILFHGAAGVAETMLNRFQLEAETHNFIILAVESRSRTWDLVERGSFGPDVNFLNKALKIVFDNFQIDRKKIGILGFSDGASYALSMGAINGDLITHILAFSPGFMLAPSPTGKPEVCISHGQIDAVLNIETCSRRIVPILKRDKYTVRYHEFWGGHIMPAELIESGLAWFLE